VGVLAPPVVHTMKLEGTFLGTTMLLRIERS